jgi:hypothetical protein
MDFYQWTAAAVIVALSCSAWWLVRVALRRMPWFAATHAARDHAAWNAKYRSDWRRGLGEGLLALAGAALVIALALAAFAASRAEAGDIRLAPNLLLWGIPALLLAWPIGRMVWNARRARALGPQRTREVLVARERQDGLRRAPLAWLERGLTVAAGLVAAVVLADWQMRVGPDALAWDPLWTLQERTYRYAEVRSVQSLQSRKAWHGDIVRAPSWRIELADGRAWESWRVSHGHTQAELGQIMRLVAQRSGRAIETVDPYPRGLPAEAPRADRKTAPSS